jgi:ABC-2 type transport system permease protein
MTGSETPSAIAGNAAGSARNGQDNPNDRGDTAVVRTGIAGSRRILRLRGLIRKETLQILRDPSSISIAFVLPAVLLILFGYGVSLDAEHVPVAIVVESPSNDAVSFALSIANSHYFSPRLSRNRHEARAALRRGDVQAFVVLREDFSRRIKQGSGAAIQVTTNGTDANTARIINGYLDGVWQVWLKHFGLARGQPIVAPVDVEHRVWFNADVRSRNFLVPGLIAIIMTLIGALLTAMVIAREWERGTMEALMVTPVGINEILIGKLVPYFALGMGSMLLSTALAVWVFGVPLRGSFLVLLLVSAIFMLAALGLGLLISTVARSQFVAGQVAIIVAFLPAFILSGFVFDITSMPSIVQAITHIVPARYFVSSLQTLFLAGTVWRIIFYDLLALGIMAIVLIGLTRRMTKKSLGQ